MGSGNSPSVCDRMGRVVIRRPKNPNRFGFYPRQEGWLLPWHMVSEALIAPFAITYYKLSIEIPSGKQHLYRSGAFTVVSIPKAGVKPKEDFLKQNSTKAVPIILLKAACYFLF